LIHAEMSLAGRAGGGCGEELIWTQS
jgi:hypothetical protein